MQARGQLMIEHRLIEQMILVIRNLLSGIESKREVDPAFIDTIVDFFRVYADKTHHGKEEDILFRKLDDKQLTAEDRQVMENLIEEHVSGRKTSEALAKANARYRDGDDAALKDIAANLQTLTEFYPRHIEEEDKVFFPSSRGYFTDEEDQAMLAEFREFDGKMIHEKYKSVVEELNK